MPVLRERNLQNRLEIFVDGGVRRASDILKALAMGATGVGLGRPFRKLLSAYPLLHFSANGCSFRHVRIWPSWCR